MGSIASSTLCSLPQPDNALQTKNQQKASRRRYLESGQSKYAFFADMGGTEINPPDLLPFRVIAKQLHYRVTMSHMSSHF